jgi:hypothetical protein
VEYELTNRVADRPAVSTEQTSNFGSAHRAVYSGEAQTERVGEFLNREAWMKGELQGHNNVLGVEVRLHGASIFPISRKWK